MTQTFVAQLPGVLRSLRDIENVRGSFLFARGGQLLARDLPGMFGEDALTEVAMRAARLWETLTVLDRTLDQTVLQYQDHKIYMRSVVQGFLCALVDAQINAPALRMALNLVVKRVNPLLAEIDLRELRGSESALHPAIPAPEVVVPEATLAAPAAVEATPPPPSSAAKRSFIVYRGRRYEV